MAVAARAFVDELRDIVNQKHTMNHPLVRRIADGTFSIPELRFFAQQYYQRTARMFPKLVAAAPLCEPSCNLSQFRVDTALHAWCSDPAPA